MSEFLESEIVQEELGDINKMLEKIYEKFFIMDRCPVMENLNTLIC